MRLGGNGNPLLTNTVFGESVTVEIAPSISPFRYASVLFNGRESADPAAALGAFSDVSPGRLIRGGDAFLTLDRNRNGGPVMMGWKQPARRRSRENSRVFYWNCRYQPLGDADANKYSRAGLFALDRAGNG